MFKKIFGDLMKKRELQIKKIELEGKYNNMQWVRLAGVIPISPLFSGRYLMCFSVILEVTDRAKFKVSRLLEQEGKNEFLIIVSDAIQSRINTYKVYYKRKHPYPFFLRFTNHARFLQGIDGKLEYEELKFLDVMKSIKQEINDGAGSFGVRVKLFMDREFRKIYSIEKERIIED